MKKLTWIILVVLVIATIIYFLTKPKFDAKNLDYNYVTLEKGDIEAIVSSTGTLEAINTVEVGTQISGTIKRIYVDFNDKVKAGQLLAEMDLKLLYTNLINAEANLSVAQAKLNQAKEEFERDKSLFGEKVISEQEYSNSKYVYAQALSAKEAALASVKSIKVTMGYAKITSPISGTVIDRSVEEGQTVAASFATPKMFVIAEDLSKMQLLADVDESDIGYILNGMEVRFTVQTFQDKKFHGNVSQIRLQPIKINNVVNYQVVIDVDNKNGELLPGMTANIEFITNVSKNVLIINNSALRYRPNEVMLKEIKPFLLDKAKAFLPDSIQQNFINSINNEELYTPVNFKKKLPPKIDGFFCKDENGELDFKFIQLGIKTGLKSEIVKFLDDNPLKEGQKAINAIKQKK
ncbi:efflux RND transporter periplasmic adaptor subunit [Lutibacter sp.]|uniref:efflux RND transporter periplasmic adaptor subunit n=1 Tax=Lutibacter sp. TaxID=1925666 RepID=UPI00356494D5